MKNLIILRGLPSSGKTTFSNLLETKAICSADDWHYRKGMYDWKFENNSTAHNWCQRKCERFMKKDVPKIVVVNTNTTEKEFEPYIELANKYGYLVFSVILEKRHDGMNDHNVPETTIEKMRERFDIKL